MDLDAGVGRRWGGWSAHISTIRGIAWARSGFGVAGLEVTEGRGGKKVGDGVTFRNRGITGAIRQPLVHVLGSLFRDSGRGLVQSLGEMDEIDVRGNVLASGADIRRLVAL